jgi:hypothetical protein
LAAGRSAAAIAAGLYALEIYLKVRICKKLNLESLPKEFEIHDLEGLMVLCGLFRRLNGKPLQGTKLRQNWDKVLRMSGILNDLRYLPAGNWASVQAQEFLDQLREPRHGVLTWLQRQR